MRTHVGQACLGALLCCSGCSSGFTGPSTDDQTPPVAGLVSDGLAGDIDQQTSPDTLSANWTGFSDSGSGVAGYDWAIGTTPGAEDVRAWTFIGMATSASASGLSLLGGRTYFVSVRAVDNAGNVGQPAISDGILVQVTPSVTMDTPSDEAVGLAVQADLIWFDESLSGGAHSWIVNGGTFGRAAVAYSGDTRADARLLEQIRHLLTPGNGLTATGGYQDQKQLCATGMFTLAKHTPRIWSQLSQGEQDKISLMVHGALVSSAFTTSDHNPFVQAGTTQHAMNGDSNLHRDWNPNYRNGMLGTVIVASLFFGSDHAQQMLRAHDHQQFTATLLANGLTNLHKTYTRSDPDRPTAAQVNATLRQDYVYYGIPLADVMDLYLSLTEFTYGGTVNCGLNGGTGRVGSNGVRGGYVLQNCASLPNQGMAGMLAEFDSVDGGGPRSSALYANDGWYVNTYVHYVIAALGRWEDSARANSVLDRIDIGTEDLDFKLDPQRGGGYYDFEGGQGNSTPTAYSVERGHAINFSIAEVLRSYHGR